jgi:hypothetical protein
MPARLVFAVLAVLCLQASASAAPLARVSVGVYGNVARFDRLTGQETQSGRKPRSLAAYKRYIVPLTR